jgi:hypothetical protein
MAMDQCTECKDICRTLFLFPPRIWPEVWKGIEERSTTLLGWAWGLLSTQLGLRDTRRWELDVSNIGRT